MRRVEDGLRASGTELRRAPAAGSWSALEIAEHTALMNHHVLLLVETLAARCRARLARGERPPAEPSRLDFLERLAGREFRWQSPAHMVPGGHATSRELAATLRAQRRRALALLARMRDGEGALHRVSMSVVGRNLDLYQFLALIALHAERHASQMDRARLLSGGTGSGGASPA